MTDDADDILDRQYGQDAVYVPAWGGLKSHAPQQPEWMKWLQGLLGQGMSRIPPEALYAMRAPVGVMRSMDLALRPLTAEEMKMAEAYGRALGMRGEPRAQPPKANQNDPPSFYEMWSKQGESRADGGGVPGQVLRGLNNFAEGAGDLVSKAGDQLTDPNLLLHDPLKRPSLVSPAALRMINLFAREMMQRGMQPPAEDQQDILRRHYGRE